MSAPSRMRSESGAPERPPSAADACRSGTGSSGARGVRRPARVPSRDRGARRHGWLRLRAALGVALDRHGERGSARANEQCPQDRSRPRRPSADASAKPSRHAPRRRSSGGRRGPIRRASAARRSALGSARLAVVPAERQPIDHDRGRRTRTARAGPRRPNVQRPPGDELVTRCFDVAAGLDRCAVECRAASTRSNQPKLDPKLVDRAWTDGTPSGRTATPSRRTANHPGRTARISKVDMTPCGLAARHRANHGSEGPACRPAARAPAAIGAGEQNPSSAQAGTHRRSASVTRERPARHPGERPRRGQKKEPARRRALSLCQKKIPAASYSPTRLPVQYHRLRRA